MSPEVDTVSVRPLVQTDIAAWRVFYTGLTDRSVYRRFFGSHPHPSDAEVSHFFDVDHVERMAFIAEQNGTIVGMGRYDRIGTLGAEIALISTNDDEDNGVDPSLLEHLVGHARHQGVHQFLAATVTDNTEMANVFRNAGFQAQTSTSTGITRVALDLTPDSVGELDLDSQI